MTRRTAHAERGVVRQWRILCNGQWRHARNTSEQAWSITNRPADALSGQAISKRVRAAGANRRALRRNAPNPFLPGSHQ